jgi:hypothetical protein
MQKITNELVLTENPLKSNRTGLNKKIRQPFRPAYKKTEKENLTQDFDNSNVYDRSENFGSYKQIGNYSGRDTISRELLSIRKAPKLSHVRSTSKLGINSMRCLFQ